MIALLLAMAAASSQAGQTANSPSLVDFDLVCEMILPTRALAKLSGHVRYDSASAQLDDIGTMEFVADTTPDGLGALAVTIAHAGEGFVLGIQKSDAVLRSFVLDARPGGNASLLVAEGVLGRKMVALGYCDITGLKDLQ